MISPLFGLFTKPDHNGARLRVGQIDNRGAIRKVCYNEGADGKMPLSIYTYNYTKSKFCIKKGIKKPG